MPRISEFYGIVISIHRGDHPPPHFHAIYGEYEAKFAIATGLIIKGRFPVRASRLVRQWTRLYPSELMTNWELIHSGEPLIPIEPLP